VAEEYFRQESPCICVLGSPNRGLLTIDIQPHAYPPDKAVTVWAYSGNVQVTVEMSPDCNPIVAWRLLQACYGL
jgi:hypothetical protein